MILEGGKGVQMEHKVSWLYIIEYFVTPSRSPTTTWNT